MAYSPGISPVDVATGAEAATDLLAQPSKLQDILAKTKLDEAKSERAQMRLAAEKSYMQAEKTLPAMSQIYSSAPDPGAIDSGKGQYATMQLSQELQQRKARLAQEEKNIRLLLPEDRVSAEVALQREQKQVDTLQTKLYNDSAKHLGESYSLLDSIHNEATLQAARRYMADTEGAIADEAIREGKMSPDSRQRYINDRVNRLLPQKYDTYGQVKINTVKNGMLTVQDQVALAKEAAASKRADAALKQADAASRRALLLGEKQLASHDKDTMKDSITMIKSEINASRLQQKEFEDMAAKYEGQSTLATGDEVGRLQSLANDYRSRAAEVEKSILPLEDTLKALGDTTLPKQVQQKVNEAELKRDLSAMGIPYEPDKFDYKVENGKVFRKRK